MPRALMCGSTVRVPVWVNRPQRFVVRRRRMMVPWTVQVDAHCEMSWSKTRVRSRRDSMCTLRAHEGAMLRLPSRSG